MAKEKKAETEQQKARRHPPAPTMDVEYQGRKQTIDTDLAHHLCVVTGAATPTGSWPDGWKEQKARIEKARKAAAKEAHEATTAIAADDNVAANAEKLRQAREKSRDLQTGG